MLTVTFLAKFDPAPALPGKYFTIRAEFQDQSTAELLCPPGTHLSYANGSAAYTIVAMLGAETLTIQVPYYEDFEETPAALSQLTRVMRDAGYWPVDFGEVSEDSSTVELEFCYSPYDDVCETQLGAFNDMFGRPGL